MTGILLGLVASLGWGVANFYAGIASRSWPPMLITLYTYLCELLILLGVMLLRGNGLDIGGDLYWAIATGALAVISISGFFRLLARGNIALIAPLVALTYAIVPVIFGILTSGWPKDTQLVGIGIALLAIPMMAQGSSDVPIDNIWRHSARLLGAPILVGIGFGFILILLNQMEMRDLLAPLIVIRSSGSLLLLLILLLSGSHRLAHSAGIKSLVASQRAAFGWAFLIGISDIIGYGSFILAAQLAGITIAAVTGSLPPAVTVLMARFIDKEQPRRAQVAGLVLSLVAIVLISL